MRKPGGGGSGGGPAPNEKVWDYAVESHRGLVLVNVTADYCSGQPPPSTPHRRMGPTGAAHDPTRRTWIAFVSLSLSEWDDGCGQPGGFHAPCVPPSHMVLFCVRPFAGDAPSFLTMLEAPAPPPPAPDGGSSARTAGWEGREEGKGGLPPRARSSNRCSRPPRRS